MLQKLFCTAISILRFSFQGDKILEFVSPRIA